MFKIETSKAANALWALVLFTATAVAYLLYYQALSGPFLLDDYQNLGRIKEYGGIDTWESLVLYLTGHRHGLGRPVAFLSFLLADNAWPSTPQSFKYQNVMVHLLTGLLFAWLGIRVGRAMRFAEGSALAVGVLAAALWMLHPLFVSTVLYVVQRMAMLSTMFIVAAMLVYVIGRTHLAAGRVRTGLGAMTVAMVVFFPLAVLSKENGVLLPLLLLVLEVTFLRGQAPPEAARKLLMIWKVVFLGVPLALVAGYFALRWESLVMSIYSARDFTLAERLLTEARILLEYVGLVAVPRVQTSALFNENYPVSTGLFTPPSTTIALLLIVVSAALAWFGRRQAPVLAAAVLFFLAAHVLESTFLPLELYFEHRNYLPALFLFFAFAYYLVALSKKNRVIAVVAVTGVLSLYSAFTYSRTSLWADFVQMAFVWAEENPDSVRAQQQAAILWERAGDPVRALEHINQAIRANPDVAMLALNKLFLRCRLGDVRQGQIETAARLLGEDRHSLYVYRTMEHLAQEVGRHGCEGLGEEDLLSLIEGALANPTIAPKSTSRQDLHYLKGRVYLLYDKPEEAMDAFVKAQSILPRLGLAMQMTALLATHDHYEYALAMLGLADSLSKEARQGSSVRGALRGMARDYPAEIARFRAQIKEDMARESGASPAAPGPGEG